jgi:hypothetical protein
MRPFWSGFGLWSIAFITTATLWNFLASSPFGSRGRSCRSGNISQQQVIWRTNFSIHKQEYIFTSISSQHSKLTPSCRRYEDQNLKPTLYQNHFAPTLWSS